jgi:hypothetical protein
MKKLKLHTRLCLTGLVFVLLAMAPARVCADNVYAGSDLFETAQDGTFDYHFFSDSGGIPLPADFFGPGSDPFDAPLQFSGAPLDATEDLQATSAIVERLETAVLPSIPSSDTVSIIIRALHLVDTIIVTYNGGQDPEEWLVEVCLSQVNQQDTGTMTISSECAEGGTFTSELPVDPRFTFTLLSNPATFTVIDPLPEVPLLITGDTAYWTHDDSQADSSVLTTNGGNVDHDCNGVVDEPYAATSNFVAGMQAVPCGDLKSPQGFIPRWLRELAEKVRHKVRAALDRLTCCIGIRGDVNGSGNPAPNVADLTYLVDYLFRGGPAPPCYEEGDVNGDGDINIADLTYLVDFLFRGGPPPPPC